MVTENALTFFLSYLKIFLGVKKNRHCVTGSLVSDQNQYAMTKSSKGRHFIDFFTADEMYTNED